MDIRLKDHFDTLTLQRARDYMLRGLVVSVEPLLNGEIEGLVSNGRGKRYKQHISVRKGMVDGYCSCPVSHNCKHVAAALMSWAVQQKEPPGLRAPLRGWLNQLKESATNEEPPKQRPDDYPENVKDRLLYVLIPYGTDLRVDIYKGRSNAAWTALNKAIRRYYAVHAMRSTAPAKFIRPIDLELLSALAQ